MTSAVETRKQSLFAKTSTLILIQSAFTLEDKETLSPEERMTKAWISDEIERRAGAITMDEEMEFERVFDETGSYIAALVALRPQMGDVHTSCMNKD